MTEHAMPSDPVPPAEPRAAQELGRTEAAPAAVQQVDVAVVGAGPAGLAAALRAARGGARVLVIDGAPGVGGQVWRAGPDGMPGSARRAHAGLATAGVQVSTGTQVAMAWPDRSLLLVGDGRAWRLRARQIVLATGARERLLPFPGWTLPGVHGAGGLQALVKCGWPVSGQRVVVAGTGPLLLAAAATLRAAGARIVALCEEADRARLARFAWALSGHPARGLQALALAARLAGVPWFTGCRVEAAEGEGRVRQVLLRDARGLRRLDCDALAVGWGLLPQVELGQLLGCRLVERWGARAIDCDGAQCTCVDGVLAAGECTGVAGVRAAIASGRRAGETALRRLAGRPVRPGARRDDPFAAAVARAFGPPDDLAARLRDDTVVCRCEDVRWHALRGQPDLRAAKLATRCGMGHCQGRLCHDTLALACGFAPLPARPPIVPIDLGTMLAIGDPGGADPEGFHDPAPPQETPG